MLIRIMVAITYFKNIQKVVCLIMLVKFWTLANEDLFSAITNVKPLLETHKKFTEDVVDYIRREESRLNGLAKQLNRIEVEYAKLMNNISHYLENPIKTFFIMKTLRIDSDFIKELVKEKKELKKNTTMTYPTKTDLHGAAQALATLQLVYNLNVTDLANGILLSSTPMSASDCAEVGNALYKDKDFVSCIRWLEEAYHKYNADEYKNHSMELLTTKIDIVDKIVFSYYLLNNIRKIIEWTKHLIALKPGHSRLNEYKRLGEHFQASIKEDLNYSERYKTKPPQLTIPANISAYSEGIQHYLAICRGKMDISSEMKRRLKCHYLTESHPFLLLARVKIEQLYLQPDVLLFHDVISDHEIEHLKEKSLPRLHRCTVRNTKTDEVTTTTYRINKVAWLEDKESDVISRISRRVSYFTGLSMTSAEPLQVANYGLGGHFKQHYDYSDNPKSPYGNVIATVLFYLSDVTQGGATVFTELGLSVFPVKRAALFWMNLLPNGKGDLNTLHAACPVLRGSKWVSNKWIHESGQDFRKKCDLGDEYYLKENVSRKIPPVRGIFRD